MVGDRGSPDHCTHRGIRVSWFENPPGIAPQCTCCAGGLPQDRGIAGFDDRLVIFDNGVVVVSGKTVNQEIEINKTDIDRIVTLFNQSQFSLLEGNYSARPGSTDLIKYAISYNSKTVNAEDSAIPPALQPVIDELNRILILTTGMKQTPGLAADMLR